MSEQRYSSAAVMESEEAGSVLSYSGRRVMMRVARRNSYTLPSWVTNGFVLGEREYGQSITSDDIPTEPRYVMEALMPKEAVAAMAQAMEAVEAANVGEEEERVYKEDVSWLNDVAPRQSAPIHKERFTAEHLLTCWF
jgi:hypothetical protein